MCPLTIEAIGLAAGLTNLVSSLPQLIANLKNPSDACKQSPLRNACQCLGNALWLVYGLSVGSFAMILFSSLGSLMAAALLWQVIRSHQSRRGLRHNGGAYAGTAA
ncbi:MAG: hypothetical protein AAGF94_04395 [Pseudomonadota bacterium]